MDSEQCASTIDSSSEIGIELEQGKKRPWHFELAISLTIAGLGGMVWLASTQAI